MSGSFGGRATKTAPYGASHNLTKTVTIASGATTSDAFDAQGYPSWGIILPSTYDGTALAIHVSDTLDGTYQALYDSDGNAISLVVAASRSIGLTGVDAQAVAAFRFFKLVAGTSQSTSDTVITIVLKG